MWICPDCERKFSRNNQSHSCEAYPLDSHFFGKSPKALQLFNYLTKQVRTFGEIEVFPGKFHITYRHLSTFATILIEKNHLTIVFISEESIDEFPVHQTHQISQYRWSNVIKVESVDEIDDQLVCWLHNAWSLAI